MNEDGIYDDESIGVSAGDVICGFKSQDTIHSFSRTHGVYHCGDWNGDDGRGVCWSHTSQSS